MSTRTAPLLVLLLFAACASSPPPVANASSSECRGIVWPTTLAAPSTPETHSAAALRVLEVSGLRTAYAQMLEISLQSTLKVNPALKQYEDAFREFFAKYASYDAISGDFAALYTRVFSELQLRQIEAFYRTPTGMLAVAELSKIMAEGGKIGERKVQEHQAELIEILTKHTTQPQPPPLLVPKGQP